MTAADPRPTYVALLGVAGHGIDALVNTLGGEDERKAHGVRAVTVRTAGRCFRLVAGDDHLDVLQVLFLQQPLPHAVVPVVSAEIGVTVGVREQLFVASQLGISVPAAVVTHAGAAFEFVERSLRMRLVEDSYPADDVPVLPAEATGDLLAALATIPASAIDGPYLQAIENIYRVGLRTVITGTVERGIGGVGDELEVVGLRPDPLPVRFAAIEDFGLPHDVDGGRGVVLEGVAYEDLAVGQVLALPGTTRPSTVFDAVVHLRPANDWGRRTPVRSGYRGQLHLRNADWSAEWTLAQGREALAPGEVAGVRVELSPEHALAVYPGLAFGVREGRRTVGWARVTRVVG